jgi:LPXTG-motif cell wall-anchored protein
MAFLTAMVMVLGCVAMNVYAEGETTTKTGKWAPKTTDSTLGLDSTRDNRSYKAYQLFYGNKSGDILTDLEWGASVTDSWALIQILQQSEVNGRTNTVYSAFADLEETSTAEDLAKIIKGITDTDAKDMLAYDLIYAFKQQTPSDEAPISIDATYVGVNSNNSEIFEYTFGAVHTGYYLVEDTTKLADNETKSVSKYMAKVVGPTTIETKEQNGPTIEKKIVTEDEVEGSTEGLVDEDGVGIDDTVKFKLTSKVPNMEGYNKYFFIMEDVLSDSLTYDKNNDNMVITIGEKTDPNYKKLTRGTDYYIVGGERDATTGLTNIKIVFKDFILYKNMEDAPVVVYYTATVDEDVVPGDVEDNYNKVRINYSNNPSYNYKGYNSTDPTQPDGDEPDPGNGDEGNTETDNIGSSQWDTVYVYTGAIRIVKTDGSGNRITGAKFKVVPKDGTRTLTRVVRETSTQIPYGYYSGDTTSAMATEITKDGSELYLKKTNGDFTQNLNDDLKLEHVKYNLVDGNYEQNVAGTLYREAGTDKYVDKMDTTKTYETAYVVYKKEVTHEVQSVAGDAEWDVEVGTDGVLEIMGLPEGEYDIIETQAPSGYNKLTNSISMKVEFTYINSEPVFTYVFDDAGGRTYNSGSAITGIGRKVIENQEGTTLPSTGGMGTKLFYLLGAILLIVASVLLISKRRMNNNWD